MNARYPASSTGMWGQVKRTHVVAAIAATIGVMVGAGGVAAWDAANDSDGARTVYTPPAINIDRLAEGAGSRPVASAAQPVESIILEHDASMTGAGFPEGQYVPSSAAPDAAAFPPFVDVASLEATIAAHDNALSGIGVVDDTSASASGPFYPPSREGVRGHVEGGAGADDIGGSTSGPLYPSSREGVRGHVEN